VARRSGHIRFNDIRRLRLTYRPTSMQSHRFMTELWAQGAPKLEILSSSWKSMIEQQRLDRPYTAFITELHRRIALAAPPARFERGSNPLLYWSGLIVFTGLTLALALLAVRALQSDTKAGAAFVGVFLLLLLWQFLSPQQAGRLSCRGATRRTDAERLTRLQALALGLRTTSTEHLA